MGQPRAELRSLETLPPTRTVLPSSAEARVQTISVIVPTRNEAENIAPLLQHLQNALAGLAPEIIFVDDSTDATPQVVEKLAPLYPFPVTVIARPLERRNGLGKAVVEGIAAARSEWICVMDGDLQHPPEVIPQLLNHAHQSGATLVAASRLTEGGSTAGLSFRRKLISYFLAFASRIVFPKRLRQISDPLTGFFLVRRDAVDTSLLRPEGFKILLEILVRSPKLTVSEVPFEFGERYAGASKANSREAALLFKQMARLCLGAQAEMLRFGVVGLGGFAVNTLLLALFTEIWGVYYLASVVLATQGSSLWNFLGTEGWVFRGRPHQRKQLGFRFVSYMTLNNAALLLRGPLIVLLVALNMHYLWANIVSLIAMFAVRYFVSDRLIWRRQKTVLSSDLGEVTATSILPTEKL